jgi:hypothetical protein
MSYLTRQKKVKNRKRQAAIKRNLRSETARWRTEPATELQWKVLRRIERATGRTFADSMTKGEASERITQRFAQDDHAARAHRRSQRARKNRAGERTQLGGVA